MQVKNQRKVFFIVFFFCARILAGDIVETGTPLTILFSGSANAMLRSCHCPNAPWGGLAKRAWFIGQIRREAGSNRVAVIDSGDLFPIESDPSRSALMLRLMASMKYDVVAAGDQELAGGLEMWKTVHRKAGLWNPDIQRAGFPWLSGAFYEQTTPASPRDPAPVGTVIERAGLRIGVVAVMGESAWRFARARPETMRLDDPQRTVSEFLKGQTKPLDMVIVVSHQGLDADRALAERLEGVDLILGGHSQSLINPPEIVNGIAICQAGKNGENLGVLVLTPLTPPAGDGETEERNPTTEPQADTTEENRNPFLATVIETPRWRIAQQIVPMTTTVEDDPEAARMIDAYYSAIDKRNATRLATPDPEASPEAPQLTVTIPDDPVVLNHGERQDVILRIQNRGNTPLDIERVRSRSPWMEVRSFPQRIAPGADAEAVLQVVANRIDRFFRCEFSILSNDPRRRVAQGAFAGRIQGSMPDIMDVAELWNNLARLSAPPSKTSESNATANPNSETENNAPASGPGSGPRRRVLIEYYHAPGCPDCRVMERDILPAFSNRFAHAIDFRKYDVTVPANYLRLARLQERLEIRSNEPVSIYIDGEIALLGLDNIRANLERVTLERSRMPAAEDESSPRLDPPGDKKAPPGTETAPSQPDASATGIDETADHDTAPLRRRLETFTVPAVMLAGLVDGVNPCAFAAIVFFISLLSVSGVKAGRLLLVGTGYTLAVFTTYLIMGFGAFRLLQTLHAWQWLADALRWVMMGVLALLALLSFRDAWKFRQSGRAGDVTLQLPDSLKRRMHAIMRNRLNPGNLFLSALLIGLLVTLIEAVCTGQVYLPTLVLMSRYAETRARAFSLLLLYNVMFIVPLIIVVIAAFAGTRNQRLVEWSKRNVVWGKILMGLLFVGLAGVLLVL